MYSSTLLYVTPKTHGEPRPIRRLVCLPCWQIRWLMVLKTKVSSRNYVSTKLLAVVRCPKFWVPTIMINQHDCVYIRIPANDFRYGSKYIFLELVRIEKKCLDLGLEFKFGCLDFWQQWLGFRWCSHKVP